MARRTSRSPSRRRTSRRPKRNTYATEPERLLVSNAKHTACASDMQDWQWLSMDVCAHWRDAPKSARKIESSNDVVAICREFAQKYTSLQEFFGVLCMNQRGQPIGFAVVSVGGLASAAVDLRIVLKPPLLSNAVAFIVTHNHPSGDPRPSTEDVELTKRIAEAARVVGLRLLDHVVVADSPDGPRSFSFMDAGLLR